MTVFDQFRFLIVANALLTFELDKRCEALGFENYEIHTSGGPLARAKMLIFGLQPPVSLAYEGEVRRSLNETQAYVTVKILERNAAWWTLHRTEGVSIYTLEQEAREQAWFGPNDRNKVREAIEMIDRILTAGLMEPVPWVQIRTSVGPAIATRAQFYAWLESLRARADHRGAL